MTPEQLADVHDKHARWLRDDDGGEHANLMCADLSGAYLRGANLMCANLSGANLSGANLSGANLSDANLRYADLSGANLRYADLRGANLSDADLRGANLRYTILDQHITSRNRQHAKQHNQRGIVAYRTKESHYVGNTVYKAGRTYTAPVMSWCPNTECHPGLYAGTLEQIRKDYIGPLVKVYVRAGEYIVVNKGIRCARFRVMEDVND